ncbi:hypothetical protein FRC03_011023 [Tulasnella sp. 419]|nr:hypothetical protein FRC03_011023 [Tulasnella sp. 419]
MNTPPPTQPDNPVQPARTTIAAAAQARRDANMDTMSVDETAIPNSNDRLGRVGPSQHPDLYFSDASLIIKVDNTLFGIHKSVFSLHSNVWKEAFGIPQPTDGLSGGGTDDEITDLNKHTSVCSPQQFETLLRWLYRLTDSTRAQLTPQQCIFLLEFSRMWDMPVLRDEVIKTLEADRKALWPAHRISLAQHYHIPNWCELQFRVIIGLPDEISAADVEHLGPKTIQELWDLQQRLLRHRNTMVQSRPPIYHGPDCIGAHQKECEKSWAGYWWHEVGLKGFLDPVRPKLGEDVEDMLDSMPANIMTAGCRTLTLDAMKKTGILKMDRSAIEETIAKLSCLDRDWYGGL